MGQDSVSSEVDDTQREKNKYQGDRAQGSDDSDNEVDLNLADYSGSLVPEPSDSLLNPLTPLKTTSPPSNDQQLHEPNKEYSWN